MTAFDTAWDLLKVNPLDPMNDPLVYISGDIRLVRQDRDFRNWLRSSGYPVDDDFAQLDFMQQMQLLFHYRVQQGNERDRSFVEDNL